MDQYLREKIERSEERETQGAVKAKIRYAEHETREHEDHLRHFQVRHPFSGFLIDIFITL